MFTFIMTVIFILIALGMQLTGNITIAEQFIVTILALIYQSVSSKK